MVKLSSRFHTLAEPGNLSAASENTIQQQRQWQQQQQYRIVFQNIIQHIKLFLFVDIACLYLKDRCKIKH